MKSLLAKNIAWSAYGVVLTQAITFITLLILIRNLTPSDFGLVNMVVIIAGFANVIADFGFGQALIQNKEAKEIDYSTVFWVNIVLGSMIAIVIFFSSGYISSLYGHKELALITRVLSIKYIFSSTIIVQKIWLQKNLNFKLNANIDIAVNTLTSIITVLAVYLGFGYWSLVLQTIAESLFAMILFALYVNWKPTFHFSISSLKKLSKFSTDIFLNQSLFYWTSNLDKILIGKFLGNSALGVYKNAFAVINKPVAILSSTLLRVLFPSYSLLQNNIPELRSIVIKLFKAIGIIVIPSCLVLYLSANFIISTYLNTDWLESIPLVKIFSLAAIPFAFSSITSPVYLALGRSRLILTINLVTRSLLIILVYVALNKGLIAIAYVVLGINLLRLLIDIIQFRSLLGIKMIGYKFSFDLSSITFLLLSFELILFLLQGNVDSLANLALLLVITYLLVMTNLITNFSRKFQKFVPFK